MIYVLKRFVMKDRPHCFQQNKNFHLEKETVFHVAPPIVIVKRTEISNGEQTNRARFYVFSAASTVCSYTGVNACFLTNHTLFKRFLFYDLMVTIFI